MDNKNDEFGYATTGESQPIAYTSGQIGNALSITTDSITSMIYLGNNIADKDDTYKDVLYNDTTINVWINIRSLNSHTDAIMSIISGVPAAQLSEGGCPDGINQWMLMVDRVPGCAFGGPCPSGGEKITFMVSSHFANGVHDPSSAVRLEALEGNLSTDVWYMVTITHNSALNNWKLYINGNLEVERTMPSGIGAGALTRSCPYAIGNRPLGYNWGYPFSGKIDELGFWNRTLSGNEVSLLYNSGEGLSFQDITQGGSN